MELCELIALQNISNSYLLSALYRSQTHFPVAEEKFFRSSVSGANARDVPGKVIFSVDG